MTAATFHNCVGALLVRNGEVLLGLRSGECAWLPGAWDMFGGHVEAGESEEDALRRELAEELGIEPTELRSLRTIAAEHPDPWRLRVFAVTAWHGEPRNLQTREHAEIRWCSLDEAKRRLGPAHPDMPALLTQAIAVAPRPGAASFT